MTQATVGKWGNNLAVRLPGEIVEAAGLHAGERVEIEAQEDVIIIRRVEPRATLEAMFAGQSPGDWRAAYAGSYDWGPDVGREAVAE
jgi:antitoxin MazE